MQMNRECRKAVGQRSFTLIEVVVAIGMMAIVLMEVTSVQGNAVYFSEYSRNVTKATFLAKRVMEQVDYNWRHRDFGELNTGTGVREARFEDFNDFTYNLRIEQWKLPLFSMLTGGGGEGEGEGGGQNAQGGLMGDALKEVIGDDLLRVAHVEVFWPEGATRNSVELTYLLTNQRKADEVIATLKPTYDRWVREQRRGQPSQEEQPEGEPRDGEQPRDGQPPPPPPLDGEGDIDG